MGIIVTKKGETPEELKFSMKEVSGKSVTVDANKHVTEESELLDTVYSDDRLASVGFKAALTINLGNFNSAKVEVYLNMPCAMGEIDQTFDTVKSWVDAKMESVSAEINGNKGA